MPSAAFLKWVVVWLPCQDRFGGLGADEWLSAMVIALDEGLDSGDQFGHVLVDAAADLLFGQDREPDLDAVHPRGAGRGEVKVHALVTREPRVDLGRAVRGGVIEH